MKIRKNRIRVQGRKIRMISGIHLLPRRKQPLYQTNNFSNETTIPNTKKDCVRSPYFLLCLLKQRFQLRVADFFFLWLA